VIIDFNINHNHLSSTTCDDVTTRSSATPSYFIWLMDSHRVVWTEKYTDNNGVLNTDKKMEVWSIFGDQVYGINFIPNDVAQYVHYLPIAQKIVSTFEITK
jgi:hypothetical protein